MSKLRFILFFLFCIQSFWLSAQIAQGDWRDHLPYNDAFRVVLTADRVYAATNLALFSYDLTDHSLEKFSKVQGLSGLGISCFEYLEDQDILFVGYEDGSIDLIQNGEVQTLSDIKRYAQITGNKQINHVLELDDYLYLSTSFGIVLLDPEKKEIKDTYYIGPSGSHTEVYQLACDGNYFYAATASGLLKAPANDPNLANYSVWESPEEVPESSATYSAVFFYQNMLFLVTENEENDQVYYFTGSSWESLLSGVDFSQKRISQGKLFLVTNSGIFQYNTDLVLERTLSDYGLDTANPEDVVADSGLNLWIADKGKGLVYWSSGGNGQSFLPNGPFTDDVWQLSALSGRVYAAGGGLDNAWNNIYNNGIVYVFKDENWESLIDYTIRDIVRILIDPADPDHFYAASWGYGIQEYQGSEFLQSFDESNSSLESMVTGEKYVRIGGMDTDSDGRVWVSNTGVSHPVSVLDGEDWFSFDYTIDAPTLGELVVTEYDHKWILLPRGYGLFAFDDQGTLGTTDDDQSLQFSPEDEDGNTITSDLYSLAEDLNGDIWVGSSTGPLVYYSPQNVFEGTNFYASQIIVPGESSDDASYLLENETITSICVDGGNRKWLGTSGSGAYLVSEDGTEEILHFSSDNSPLFSDNILSIAVDDKTGEVFFGTEKGILSYRGDATGANDTFADAYVYPNPVRENYSGPIVITGLVEDTSVKITDITGNLVFESLSVGGQANWDGMNQRGKRVSTGVYLVFLSNEDGSQTHILKLLVIH